MKRYEGVEVNKLDISECENTVEDKGEDEKDWKQIGNHKLVSFKDLIDKCVLRQH